uniref:Uncharacterized protein n=1 Tax=Rangifer tarandus platyrhynchus TaxID=3082113 RepID=A0ACB0EE32_RANTA|nr:unnamed protein product [Rangifer tarandus platyrhynchus]
MCQSAGRYPGAFVPSEAGVSHLSGDHCGKSARNGPFSLWFAALLQIQRLPRGAEQRDSGHPCSAPLCPWLHAHHTWPCRAPSRRCSRTPESTPEHDSLGLSVLCCSEPPRQPRRAQESSNDFYLFSLKTQIGRVGSHPHSDVTSTTLVHRKLKPEKPRSEHGISLERHLLSRRQGLIVISLPEETPKEAITVRRVVYRATQVCLRVSVTPQSSGSRRPGGSHGASWTGWIILDLIYSRGAPLVPTPRRKPSL